MTSIALQTTRVRRLAYGALFAAAFGLTASLLGHPAIARADFSQDFYDWCMNNLSEGNEYCCEHAGGVIRQGACIDPATLKIQGGGGSTTTTRHPLPPGIMAPPATAVNPGVG
jgi:hypothetical protein